MAVKWSWDEFDVEHSIVLTSTTQSARYSNYSLILFFVKYGTITSFARLKSSKCIAIAKYAAKSDIENAFNDDSLIFYGLKMKRISDYPMYSQFDISMYEYKNSREILAIQQGYSVGSEDGAAARVPEESNQEGQPNEPEMELENRCTVCNGDYCTPNECLTKAWIEEQCQSDTKMVVDDPTAPVTDYFEDELFEPPMKSSKLDLDLLDVDAILSEPHPIGIAAYEIPNKSKVILTHVASSNTVYIRSVDRNENRAYINLIRAVAEYCDHAVPLSEAPQPGDTIAALFEGIYYRCRVVYVFEHSDEAMVDFIDFGNVEKIQLCDARHLTGELIPIKPTIKMITLKGMDSKNADAKKHLQSIATDMTKLILVNENGEHESELIIAKTGQSLNAHHRAMPAIAELKTEPKPSKSPKPIEKPNPSKPQTPQIKDIQCTLTDGHNVSVLIISNSLITLGYIHAISRGDMKKFKINDELVNEVGQEMESLLPYIPTIPGELCLVKLYDEYYRAILTDTKYKNRDRFELIDYGYILPVKKENIRRLPDDLLFPCITMKCFLDVLPPINTKKSTLTDKELTKLQERLPQYELHSFKRIKAIKLHNCCVCSI